MLLYGLLLIVSVLIVGCSSGSQVLSPDDIYSIPLSGITTDIQKFEHDASGVDVRFFVVRGPDGNIKTAFDACDVCGGYQGYAQRGTDVECIKCGRVFSIDDLGSTNTGGGCWPSNLDFVIEDGHGFFVYFNFTLLSFPKILSRIYPFAVFLSFSYILLKYEDKNELLIFWNFGIKKIHLINFFIKVSFLFVIFSLLLNALIVPTAQDKARSFIRSSDLDFFESALKPKTFVDIVKNLTIYYDRKNENGELENMFLNDKSSPNESQTTIAKTGKFQALRTI